MTQKHAALIAYKAFFGILGASAIIAEIAILVSRGTFNPVNFLSYFTVQSNIIVCIAFLLSAAGLARHHTLSWLAAFRAMAMVYILVVGIGFALLLSGLEGVAFTAHPWDNIILHYVIPMAAVIDFVIDRPKLTKSFRHNARWLLFPIVYLVYSMIRGALTGWYPYPFLSPDTNGYGRVAVISAGLLLLSFCLVWVATVLTLPRGKKKRPPTRRRQPSSV